MKVALSKPQIGMRHGRSPFPSSRVVPQQGKWNRTSAMSVTNGAVAAVQPSSKTLLPTAKKGIVTIYSTEGTNTPMECVLSFLDETGNEIAPVDVSKFESKVWKVESEYQKVEERGVYWEGIVELPAGISSNLIVLKVKADAKVEKEFINEIDLKAGDFHFNCTPNSWIHRNNGGRVFFSSQLAVLPQDTPEALKEWRQADLDDIKGSRIERAIARHPWDRIYDYDVYNDLGEPEHDRPVLGGEKFPYPRRMRTGRPRFVASNGHTYEVREKPFWVPLNDCFNERKKGNMLAYAKLGKLPILTNLLYSKLFKKLPTSFADLDNLYANVAKPVTGVSDSIDEKDTEKKSGWTTNPLFSAILGGLEQVGSQSGWLQGFTKFPPAAVYQNRTREWTKDEEWGRQALAGVNPCEVSALKAISQLGTINEEHLSPHLEGHSLASLLSQSTTSPRLLVIDHTAVFEDYAERISQIEGRYGYSGRAVLYRREDKNWVPVAVELKAGSDGTVDVYTPSDHPNLWLIAKGVFTTLDSGSHQLVSHWLRTHACTEPYIISTRRNLSMMHPVFQLMMPHFAYTLQINTNARMRLIAAGDTIESVFTPGRYALSMCSEVYKALWRFDQQGLPADLVARGLATKEGGSLKLLLEDYPYADDGMLLWNAVEKWVGSYLRLYYEDGTKGKAVTDDSELMAWWNEIVTVGHADKKEGWPALKSIDDLTQILTTMIWTVSGHHAAINYSQYPYAGYTPNRPSLCRQRIPKRDSEEYKKLIASKEAGEKGYIDTLVDLKGTLMLTLTVMLLSSHAENEVYIGDPNHAYIRDPRALKLYGSFVDEIRAMEKTIEARNKDTTRKVRSAPGLPYIVLDPTSKPGVTGRGVPQSITI